MKKKSSFISKNFLCPDVDLWTQVTKTIVPLEKGKSFNGKIFAAQDKKIPEKIFFSATKNSSFSTQLDLHGLTQTEAYQQLKSFIYQAEKERWKHVFVITGKGTSKQSPSMVQNGEKADLLQIQVPRWLEFFPQVKSWRTAPLQKGGTGVLYLILHIKKS